MKRLIKKSNNIKRLIKKFAEWTPVDPSNEDIIQVITNFMASGSQIQIEYQGSGWRLIQPYGWNTSKDGNILLMCYKDTGEIRSYRLDRINQVLIDDSLLENEPTYNNGYEIEDYNEGPTADDFKIPDLPNMEQIIEDTENEVGKELPFSEGIDYLMNNEILDDQIQNNEQIDQTQENDDNINQNEIDEENENG